MQDFITAKREEIAELCRTHHVKRLAVFGSAVRDDFDPASSDVDIILEFEDMPIEEYSDNKWALHDELVSKLNRKVDLLTWESVKNPYLLKAILRSNETIYGA
jgi:predicted nucleotidyltransferase